MATSYGFNRTRPRTQVYLDASSLGAANVSSEKPLVLIGSATGGQPGTVFELTNFAQARDAFRSGELLDAIEMAWNPSPNVSGAGKIFAIRADQATQASLVNGALTFTSNLYGVDANTIQVQLADNVLTSSKTLTVNFAPDNYTAIYDNLGNIFSVQYTGASAYGAVTITVDPVTQLATQLILKTGAAAGSATIEKTYQLGTGIFADVNAVVSDMDNLPDWTATMNTLGGDHSVNSNQLDALAETPAKTSAVTIKAVGADIVNYLSADKYVGVTYVPGGAKEVDTLTITSGATAAGNLTVTINGQAVTIAVALSDTPSAVATKVAAGVYTGFVASASGTTVTFTANTVGTASAPTFSAAATGVVGSMVRTTAGVTSAVSNIALTSLTGATTAAPPTSWANFFTLAQDLGAYYIVPLTATASVHGELSQFLRDQSTNGNQVRALVGAGLKETIDQLKARQMSIRNARVSVVGNSGTRLMTDGRVYNFPAYMLAALIGGVASGLPVGEPLTYKHINIDGLDLKFTGDQLDQLDASGVIMVEFIRTRSGSFFRIVSDPTTYNVATEPVQNRVSLGEVSDFLTTELRTILDEEFVGTRIRSTSASILKNRVESFLDQQKKVDGLIVDYNPDDVQVVITGNTARINFTVQPSQGLDYINVYINYVDNTLSA